MSGKDERGAMDAAGRPVEARPRTSKGRDARIFIALLYAMVVFAMLGSAWLFLSNVDQLWPSPRSASTLGTWTGGDTATRSFAGAFWRQSSFWRSLNLTVMTATVTMLLAALIGIPAAYGLSRHEIPGRAWIDVVFSAIIVLPSSSVGLCLIVLLQHGILRDLQDWLGISFVYSLSGIVIAQLVLSLAMGIRAWKAAFDGVNPRLEHVARSLGSSRWRSFHTVTLPCAKSGIVAGLILAWTRAAAEFGGVLIFCSTFAERPIQTFSPMARALQVHQADPLAVTMWSQIEYGNVEYGFAIGFVLVAISALSTYAIHALGGQVHVR